MRSYHAASTQRRAQVDPRPWKSSQEDAGRAPNCPALRTARMVPPGHCVLRRSQEIVAFQPLLGHGSWYAGRSLLHRAIFADNSADIRGRVLEIGDNAYTLRFGGAQVRQSDILHVDASNPRATFVGDLSRPNALPEAAFDCIVLTQTLQYLYDMRAAVATLHGAMKLGGVLLLTAPGISQLDP